MEWRLDLLGLRDSGQVGGEPRRPAAPVRHPPLLRRRHGRLRRDGRNRFRRRVLLLGDREHERRHRAAPAPAARGGRLGGCGLDERRAGPDGERGDLVAGEAAALHLGGEHEVDLPRLELLPGRDRGHGDGAPLERDPVGVAEEPRRPLAVAAGGRLQRRRGGGRWGVLPELAAGEHHPRRRRALVRRVGRHADAHCAVSVSVYAAASVRPAGRCGLRAALSLSCFSSPLEMAMADEGGGVEEGGYI